MSKVQERSDSYQKANWFSYKKNQQQYLVALRRSKRIANLHKKRHSESYTTDELLEEECEMTMSLQDLLGPSSPLTPESLELIMQTLKTYLISNEIARVEEGLTTVRNLMNYSSECLKYLTDFNIFFYIIKLLTPLTPLTLLEKSAWIISDYLAVDESRKIIDLNLAVTLLSTLTPDHSHINQHLLWALGNLSAEEEIHRVLIESTPIIQSLAPYVESFAKTTTWILSSLSKAVDFMTADQVRALCDYVQKLMKFEEVETRAETVEIIANLTSIENIETVQLIVDLGLVHDVARSMAVDNFDVRTAGLKVLGNICAVSHEHTQLVMNLGVLDLVNSPAFLQSSLSGDSMWILSNIAAGTKSQISKLTSHPVFSSLVLAVVHYDMKTRTQAITAIKNLLQAEESSKASLLQFDVFPVLSMALKETDPDYCRVLLEVCQILFSEKEYVKLLEETGCFCYLDSLSMHKNKVISDSAEEIIQSIASIKKSAEMV